MNEDFVDILDHLLDEGIEVTLHKKDGIVWYDLNTQAKSHLWISPSIGSIKYLDRYEGGTIECSYLGVLLLAKDCMYGRNYMSQKWIDLLLKESVLKRKVVETVTYE